SYAIGWPGWSGRPEELELDARQRCRVERVYRIEERAHSLAVLEPPEEHDSAHAAVRSDLCPRRRFARRAGLQYRRNHVRFVRHSPALLSHPVDHVPALRDDDVGELERVLLQDRHGERAGMNADLTCRVSDPAARARAADDEEGVVEAKPELASAE